MPRWSSSPEKIGRGPPLVDHDTPPRIAASEDRGGARAATREDRVSRLRDRALPASHRPPSTWVTRHWNTVFAKLETQASTPRCEIPVWSLVSREV